MRSLHEGTVVGVLLLKEEVGVFFVFLTWLVTPAQLRWTEGLSSVTLFYRRKMYKGKHAGCWCCRCVLAGVEVEQTSSMNYSWAYE